MLVQHKFNKGFTIFALFFVLLCLALIIPSNTFAQGTYHCIWEDLDEFEGAGLCWAPTDPGGDGWNCEPGYYPDFLLCGSFDDNEPACLEIRDCVTAECESTPTPMPTSTPTPIPTPNPANGFYNCEWDNASNQCLDSDNGNSCNTGEGYLACTERCQEIEDPIICNQTTNLSCETVFQCYPDLDPHDYPLARCLINSETGVILIYCHEDNPACDTVVAYHEDGYSCYCQVRDNPYATCYRLGAGFPSSGQLIFCDIFGDPTDDPGDNPRIYSAIGCIPVESTQELVVFLLRWSLGIAGGITLILITYGGFMVIYSTGNPQRLQAGKELITAALSGLMFILIGVFILEFIGVDILNIPGFGR